jgi:hypothetical protein
MSCDFLYASGQIFARHYLLIRVLGSKKGIIGGHNEPTDIGDWINSTTPTLVLLEKVSRLAGYTTTLK